MKKILSYVIIFVLVVATVGVATTFVVKASEDKVKICHATSSESHPYSSLNTDQSGVLSGHDDHEGDIIPPFESYEGKNWDEEHQAIYNNNCKIDSEDEGEGDENEDGEDQGKMIITKVIVGNPEASADDFSFSVDEGEPASFDVSGSNTLTVNTGTHTIVENPIPEDYTVSYENCTEVKVTKNESEEEGDEEEKSVQTPVCTITNTYVPPVDTSCEADITTASVVSDTTTMMGENNAEALSFIHSAWTAVISGATWIWGENPIADPVNNVTETFTKTFVISGTPTGATLDIAADNSYSVSVNGNPINTDNSEDNFSSGGQDSISIPANFLVSGTNTITFTVNNFAQAGGTAEMNPAGLLYKITYTSNSCGVETGDENLAPTANAGADQTITLPTNSVTLDGSLSTDSDGTIASYAWTFVSGPTTVDPSDVVGPSASPLVAGTYVFQLIVTDNDGAVSAPDTVTITVNPTIIVVDSTQCSDGVNNDGEEDSLIDAQDPGCWTDPNNSETYVPSDNDETNPIDYCPEEGFQTNPESCEHAIVDVCPNIAGVQLEVPKGKHINNSGKCVGGGSTGGGHVGGGSSTGGQVLGAESDVCNWNVDTYMRLGHKNNSEQVKTLQHDLLNGYMKAGVPEDGIYGKKTEEAVKAFQLSKKDKILTPWKLTTPTGLFYKTTLVEAKNTICPEVILPIPTDLTPWSSTVRN